MAFATRKLDKWLSAQVTSGQPRSDSYGLSQPQFALNFQNYPFKLHFVSSNAPLLVSDSQFLNFTQETPVTLYIAINEGFVYDLSRYKNSRKDPIYITKRRDGRFLSIGLDEKEFLSEDQLEGFKVPVTINGQKMKQVVPGQPGPLVPIQLIMEGQTVKFENSGENVCIYIQITCQDTNDLEANSTAAIDAADILTGDQIKEKYPDVVFFDSASVSLPGQDSTIRFLKIFDGNNFTYRCMDSASSFLSKKIVNPNSYSDELKKKRQMDLAGGEFHFVFQPRPQLYQTLRNHLFLRIW